MKRNITNLNWSALILLFSFFAVSCQEDDDNPVTPTNETEYNGTKYSMDEGLIMDYGEWGFYGQTATHYNYDFLITNGSIGYNNGDVEEINGSIAIIAELYSSGASKFNTGTFNYINSDNDGSLNESQLEAKYKDKFVFSDAGILLDTNGNKELFDDLQSAILVTGGTIKVSGTEPNYTIEYNLTLQNGQTAKGSFNKTFVKIDG